jgi:hypothetical protein
MIRRLLGYDDDQARTRLASEVSGRRVYRPPIHPSYPQFQYRVDRGPADEPLLEVIATAIAAVSVVVALFIALYLFSG